MENEVDHPRLARSTFKVSLGTFASRVLGMLRMSVMSGLFGASDANDAFVAAFKIPNLLRDMFAEGALSASFIPVFATKLKEAGRSEALQTANLMMSFLLVVVGFFVIVGIIVAPSIVSALAPGFDEIPGKFDLTVKLGRVMMPFLLVISIAALFMGMLNALGKFGTPAFAPVMLNLGMIAAGFVICPFVDPPILGMSIGVLLGGLGQCLIQLPQLLKSGFRFRPDWNFRNSDLALIVKLSAPMVIGLAGTQVNVFVITNLASQLSEGAVSYLDYSFRLLHLPLGLFSVAIATVSLPSASRLAAGKDLEGMAALYLKTLRLGLFLVLPAEVLLLLAGKPIVALLYQHHEFSSSDTISTVSALLYYSIGLVAYSSVRITVPMFYAMKETRLPVIVSLVSVVVNIILCFSLTDILDFRGLSLAVSCSGWLNFVLLFLLLSRRLPVLSNRRTLIALGKIAIPSIVVSAVVILAQTVYPCDIENGTKALWLLYTFGLLGLSAVLYLGVAKLMSMPELDSLLGLVRKRR